MFLQKLVPISSTKLQYIKLQNTEFSIYLELVDFLLMTSIPMQDFGHDIFVL
jgi:hypothetical protein